MDYRPGSEQWHWLEHDLARSGGARWRFVVCHHPPFYSNSVEILQTRVLLSALPGSEGAAWFAGIRLTEL